jgi:hypothetical protein
VDRYAAIAKPRPPLIKFTRCSKGRGRCCYIAAEARAPNQQWSRQARRRRRIPGNRQARRRRKIPKLCLSHGARPQCMYNPRVSVAGVTVELWSQLPRHRGAAPICITFKREVNFFPKPRGAAPNMYNLCKRCRCNLLSVKSTSQGPGAQPQYV